MEIQGKKVLILGGYGLVGFEVAKQVARENPKSIIILSLRQEETDDALERLQKIYPDASFELHGEYGNIFINSKLKDTHLMKVKNTEDWRDLFNREIFGELEDEILKASTLYQVLAKHQPEVVVDTVNTATAISYQNIFETTRSLQQSLELADKIAKLEVSDSASPEELVTQIKSIQKDVSEIKNTAELTISSMYIPQLVRHIQILQHALRDGGVRCYIKVGTSGTGGMGLNIPYTHGEERPSRVLMSKAAVGGAHTLLLFLLARTPGTPVIKEIKPTAAIAWRAIDYGEIKKGDNSIWLYNTVQESLDEQLHLRYREGDDRWKDFSTDNPSILKSVYIDTGENGLFSRGEFEAISSMQQMEFVTPEEISRNIIMEIKGMNTGKDVLNSLDSASMGPTYRAGFLRTYALTYMKELEEQHDCSSVAFEMLGPPRLSKLLFECYLLKLVYGTFDKLMADSAEDVSAKCHQLLQDNESIASKIASIGIPILLPDGKTLRRGPFIKIPPAQGRTEVPLDEKHIDLWARDGWVDLRVSNMEKWLDRLRLLQEDLQSRPAYDTSSASERGRMFSVERGKIEMGEVVGWIFNIEEQGARMKR